MSGPSIDISVIRSIKNGLPNSLPCFTSTSSAELSDFVNWLDVTVSKLERPGSAWLLGSRCDYRTRGLLGHVVTNASSLGLGLRWLCRFYALVQDATSLKLEVEGATKTARLSYRILDPTIWPRHNDALYSLGVFSALLRSTSPESWSECRIWVEGRQTDFQSDLARLTQVPVCYGATHNAISFPAKLLELPMRGRDAVDQQHITQLSQAITQKHRTMPIAERSRYVILDKLQESTVSQESVARELGLSSRTLRRKLSQEGESYQDILDTCRMQLAAHELLSATNVSLSQMALRLGYSEHSTFTRAFSRWSGVPPRDYRNFAFRESCGSIGHLAY